MKKSAPPDKILATPMRQRMGNKWLIFFSYGYREAREFFLPIFNLLMITASRREVRLLCQRENEWMNEWMMCVQRTALRSAMVSVVAAVQAVLLPLKPPTITPPAFCGNTESANGPAAMSTAIIQPSFSGHCSVALYFTSELFFTHRYCRETTQRRSVKSISVVRS